MPDVIGLGGPPATGKSTAIKEFLRVADLVDPAPFEYGLLKGTVYDQRELILLGLYDDGDFTGTDRLAMHVADDAKDFITAATDHDQYHDYTILYEGDRLFTGPFIHHCRTECGAANTWFPVLHADHDELDRRHNARDDDQSESWLDGRHTKYDNLTADYDLATVTHNDRADLEHLVERLCHATRDGVADTIHADPLSDSNTNDDRSDHEQS